MGNLFCRPCFRRVYFPQKIANWLAPWPQARRIVRWCRR